MKDPNALSNLLNMTVKPVFTVVALAVFTAASMTAFAQNADRNIQNPSERMEAIAAIQFESDSMRRELIQSYRTTPQFGDLIGTNAKIKGSAKRLVGKLNLPNVNWATEAQEMDQLIFGLESLIEEANFQLADQAPSQASTYLGNMLGYVEAIKNPTESNIDTRNLVGQTGLTDSEVENFFEADFDPIEPSDPAPAYAPTTVLKPMPQSQVVDDPFASAPSLRGPATETIVDNRPLIEQPLILSGDQADREIATSVLESPDQVYESVQVTTPNFQNEVRPPTLNPPQTGSPLLEVPNITAPTPEMAAMPQPQFTLKPQVDNRTTRNVPAMMAPTPYQMRPATRVAQLPRIEVYMVKPSYVPYGGYGGNGYRSGGYGPYGSGYGASRIRTGYVPYGGYGGRSNSGRYCPYGR